MQDKGSQDLWSKYGIIFSRVHTKLLGFLDMWLIFLHWPDLNPKISCSFRPISFQKSILLASNVSDWGILVLPDTESANERQFDKCQIGKSWPNTESL